MIYLSLTCLMMALAITVHSISAWLQRRYEFYNHLGSLAWATHQFVIAPAWVIFIVMSTQIGSFVHWRMTINVPEAGWLLLGVAVLLFMSAIQKLGVQCLTNGNLFGKPPSKMIHTGVYKYFDNPIYDSFTLTFVAVALITNNFAYITLAAVAHVLLSHVLARLENLK